MKEAGEMSRFSTAKFTGEEYEFAYKLINVSARDFRDFGEYKNADSHVLELAHRLEMVNDCRQTVLALIQKEQKRREECQ
jgi:hypothetical protein